MFTFSCSCELQTFHLNKALDIWILFLINSFHFFLFRCNFYWNILSQSKYWCLDLSDKWILFQYLLIWDLFKVNPKSISWIAIKINLILAFKMSTLKWNFIAMIESLEILALIWSLKDMMNSTNMNISFKASLYSW